MCEQSGDVTWHRIVSIKALRTQHKITPWNNKSHPFRLGGTLVQVGANKSMLY
jgi:hypothetical protein